jgi:hypothetical protein
VRDALFQCDRCGRPALSVFSLAGDRHLVFEPVRPDDPSLSDSERALAATGTMVRASKCGTWLRATAREAEHGA